ncbi:MAG TPA: alpha/beta hydrolase [Baekduia sp.]|nr:alpha/beta hydrolase [Baekduia sp.]
MRVAVVVALSGILAVGAGCGGDAPAPPQTATIARPAAAAAADPAIAPKLHPRRCRTSVGAGFRCATLTVALHRRGAHIGDGRTLTLDVAVQRGRRPPRGDFLILSGGPGQPGLPFAPRMAQRLGRAAANRRIVVVDQRGTGRNAIRCPALQRSVGTSDVAVPSRAAVAACARTLGAARDAYATADTLADLDAVRRALRDATWTIGGISYGAFVAERYALTHPRQTRALVLDSVVPQQGVELLERVPLRATARVLRALDRGAGDPVANLRVVLARHPELGPALFDAITARSIGVPRLDELPSVLRQAADGQLAPLRMLVRTAAGEQQQVPAAFFSAGLHAATLCADAPALWRGGPAAPAAVRDAELARLRTDMPAAQTAPWPPSTALGQGLLATCRAWPPTAAPPAPDARATIRVPTLLLAGDRDLSTPLEWARAQARRMPHAELVVVAGAGHSILSREQRTTGRDALRRFLAAH